MPGRDSNRGPSGKQACYLLSYATLLVKRLGPASAFFFILVPDWLDVGRSGILAFSKTVLRRKGVPYTLHVYTADYGEGYTQHGCC